MRRHCYSASRQTSAQSLVEVTVGVVVLIVVVIFLIDLALLIYAVSLNDMVCRDAAQQAASGDPSDAEARALTSIENRKRRQADSFRSAFRLIPPVKAEITGQPGVRIDAQTDEPKQLGGMVTGTVSVTTEVETQPFVVHLVLGKKPPLSFRSTAVVPIKFVRPAQ